MFTPGVNIVQNLTIDSEHCVHYYFDHKEQSVLLNERESELPEQSFAIRQDVFGVLAKLKKGPMEAWFLLMKLLECQEPWTTLPSKLHADARVLVERGIVLEDAERPGAFRVNPEIAYVSSEPTISEVLREGDS